MEQIPLAKVFRTAADEYNSYLAMLEKGKFPPNMDMQGNHLAEQASPAKAVYDVSDGFGVKATLANTRDCKELNAALLKRKNLFDKLLNLVAQIDLTVWLHIAL